MVDETNIFDEESYLEANPDVAEAVAQGFLPNGLAHFQAFGRAEGRSPNSFFDADAYLERNPDVAAAVESGFVDSAWGHFAAFGAQENRAPNRVFDPQSYKTANRDVEDAGMDATEHFLTFGAFEGRDLGNGVSLANFINDSKFQNAVAQNNASAAAARVSEVAPFIPGFVSASGESVDDVVEKMELDLPDDFERPSEDFILSLPPGLQGRVDNLPPPFRPLEDGDQGLPPGLRGRDDLPPAFQRPPSAEEPDEEPDEEPAEDPDEEPGIQFALSFEAGALLLENETAVALTMDFDGTQITVSAEEASESVEIPEGDPSAIDGVSVVTDTTLELTLGDGLAADGEAIAAGDLGTLTLSGEGAVLLEAGAATLAAFESIDASGLSGSFALDASAAESGLTITGGASDDLVAGGSGDDTLNASNGSDTYVLGGGANTIVYTDGEQSFDGADFAALDSVENWDSAADVLDFSALGTESFTALEIEADEGDDLAAMAQKAFEALDEDAAGAFGFEGDTYILVNLAGDDPGSLSGSDLLVEIVGQHTLGEDNVTLAA